MAAIGKDMLGDRRFQPLIGMVAEGGRRFESGHRISERQGLLDAAGFVRHLRRLAGDQPQEAVSESRARPFEQEGGVAHQRHQTDRRHIG